jgi:hypothetical protein
MQKQRMKSFLPLLCFLFFAFSCSDEAEPERGMRAPSDGVYADYQVWAEEGGEEVTVRLQYHRGDSEGPAFALQNPGRVLLDGEQLVADSTRYNGVFYEVSKPAGSFIGDHTIVFVSPDGKQQQETFTFTPFVLSRELPARIRKKPFSIALDGLPEESSPVRLVMIDTAYESDDVNEVVAVEGGKLEITARHLANLTKGPVVLEIYSEDERALAKGPKNSGRFTLTYGLKRQFDLVE